LRCDGHVGSLETLGVPAKKRQHEKEADDVGHGHEPALA
jgi:hypothetical protein